MALWIPFKHLVLCQVCILQMYVNGKGVGREKGIQAAVDVQGSESCKTSELQVWNRCTLLDCASSCGNWGKCAKCAQLDCVHSSVRCQVNVL